MITWFNETEERRRQILSQATARLGLSEQAIEKDWWVTLALQGIFATQWKDQLIFKGGTSLSKGWGLIERFSEDIDLAIDRTVLKFPDEFVSKAQVAKLRKTASYFIAGDFRADLQRVFLEMGVPADQFQLNVAETELEDRDPQVLELHYHSVLITTGGYLVEKVLIEIGARSMMEPVSPRPITTLLSQVFPRQAYAGTAFEIPVVEPRRTLLEKVFLLHEEFSKPSEKIRSFRLSRHLYDLEKLMDTEHAAAALADPVFYEAVIEHRRTFTAIRGLDYSLHASTTVSFTPPDAVMAQWREDYQFMRENMIYGAALEFEELLARLGELQQRFRDIPQPADAGEEQIPEPDPAILDRMVERMKATIVDDPLYLEGTEIELPHLPDQDPYQAAGHTNDPNTYMLKFRKQQEKWEYVGIRRAD